MREGRREGGSVPICIFISTSPPTVRRRGEGEGRDRPGQCQSAHLKGGRGFTHCSTELYKMQNKGNRNYHIRVLDNLESMYFANSMPKLPLSLLLLASCQWP